MSGKSQKQEEPVEDPESKAHGGVEEGRSH